jgi:excisionase family DNA binding protein
MIMAGMFYSLKETAEKLNMTDDQVKDLAKDGKLREFRDGSNVLFKIDEVEQLMSDTSVAQAQEVPTPPEKPAQAPELEEVAESAEPQAAEPEQEPQPEPARAPEQIPELEPVGQEDEEISLAPEMGTSLAGSDLTDADTALTGQGVSVLGETDRDYQVTDDTMAETTTSMGTTGTAPEASLEEVEEDVNLDSFGSGSGLLDLSLQADDTSLGGILDEIYTSEGGEEQGPAEASSAAEMAAEAEQMIPEEELVGPQPAPEMPAVAPAYVELEPDVQSNTFGMLLFLPLLVLLYTTIIAVAAQKGVMPSILASIQNIIWYIVIGAIVVTGLVVGAAFMLSGDLSSVRSQKQKKPKRAKRAEKTLAASEDETT